MMAFIDFITSFTDQMSRILCKTYLSNLQPMCRKASDIVYHSVLEIVLNKTSEYIYYCVPELRTDRQTDIGILNPGNIQAIRQRSDLVFAGHVFDFDNIYGSESNIAWETSDGSHFQNSNEALKLYNITYSCISGYTTTVIPLQSSMEVVTRSYLYIEGRERIVSTWQTGSPYQSLEETYEDALRHKCKITLSAKGEFFVGGPGTQITLGLNYPSLFNFSSGNKTFILVGGILNNLERKYLSTSESIDTYIMEYVGDRLDFILPLGGNQNFQCFLNM